VPGLIVTKVALVALVGARASAATGGATNKGEMDTSPSNHHVGFFTPHTVAVRSVRDNPICEVRPFCPLARNASCVVGSFRRIVRVDLSLDAVTRGTGVLVDLGPGVLGRFEVGGGEGLGHLVGVAHALCYPEVHAADVA